MSELVSGQNFFQKSFKSASKYTDIALAAGIIGILLVLLFPVHVTLLDILLAFSITISVLVLMTTLFILHPLDLSAFPTLLLVTTMIRLSLNIASTRLILSNGHTGPSAAGHVIEAFGGFVMQGNLVIGLIVFIILTLINFIVITKGSGRIAEVAARFSLDAMPGKQMAIDADLAAGLIDEKAAKARRQRLEDESTFYGAMDGANKFVRGDAIAGLLITGINLVAGIIIGVAQKGMSFDSALKTYTILTIGDGLVSQIPSLVISLAAGLLVSKAGVAGSTDKALFGQLGKYPNALIMSSGVTGLMAFLPGLPFLPFIILSLITGSMAYALKSGVSLLPSTAGELGSFGADAKTGATAGSSAASGDADSEAPKEEPISQSLQLDMIKLELGYGLLPLLNYQKGHKLTEQIKALRRQIAKDFGFVMPSVRIQDNLQLENNRYIIKIKEIEVGRGDIIPDKLLIMNPAGDDFKVLGQDTKEPAFGIPARWIDEGKKEEALFYNYTVVDPPTVITTHITESIKDNITELMTYSETQKLLDEVSEEHKKLVKDIIPEIVTVSVLQKILQTLLSEGISVRDLPTIIEASADAVKTKSTITFITEMVRIRLSRQICAANTNEKGYIPIIALSQQWEDTFKAHLMGDGEEKQLTMPPSKLQDFVNRVKNSLDEQAGKGVLPVILTSGTIRPYVRLIIERFRPSTVVMSQNEIHPKTKIMTVGQV